mgnify:CR=1 FL=1
MKPYRDLLSWVGSVDFIFPTWWSGMPAILKGFIDRVFVAGFAYQNGLESGGATRWKSVDHYDA